MHCLGVITTLLNLLFTTTTTATTYHSYNSDKHNTTCRHCSYISYDVFTNCTSARNPHKPEQPTDNSTINIPLCSRTFTASQVKKQVFFYSTMYLLRRILQHCCGGYASLNITNSFSYMTEVHYSSIASSDFVYPILGRYEQGLMYGHHFLPLFHLPSSYYISLAKTKDIVLQHIIKASANLWPVLTIGILGALIAGAIAWLLETGRNKTEFPRAFHVGVFEGFWWSFVSMTTVGYGDKTPKSYLGRCFAVCWIIFGVTISAIFTANITTEIIDLRSHAAVDMQGKLVGCLNYRLNDAIVIAQNGGIPQCRNHMGTMTEGVGELLHLLHDGVIDGILVNKQTYYYFLKMITRERYMKQRDIYVSQNIIIEEVLQKRENLAYGLLIKEEHDYQYFRSYVENNWLHIQTCHNVKNNNHTYQTPKYDPDFFAPEVGLFDPILYYSLGLLGLILSSGTIYELKRYICRDQRIHPL